MAPLSRAFQRWDLLRLASAALGLAILIMVGAYAFDLTGSALTPAGAASAIALVAIAGAGLLYAWRLGAGGAVE
jgi:hypothetical protein